MIKVFYGKKGMGKTKQMLENANNIVNGSNGNVVYTDNQEVIQPLLFLRQREVVHYERFRELLEHYKKMGY